MMEDTALRPLDPRSNPGRFVGDTWNGHPGQQCRGSRGRVTGVSWDQERHRCCIHYDAEYFIYKEAGNCYGVLGVVS